MKKGLFLIFIVVASIGIAQENNTWRIGIQWGGQDNHAKFIGGMDEANARFHQKSFGAGSFNVIGRYDINNRWMIQTGLGFNSFGFEFALAENYSFLGKGARSSTIKTEFVAFEIPLMGFYKFNPNCRNAKWLVGGGFASNMIGSQTINKSYANKTEGATTPSRYLNSRATSANGGYLMLRFAVGREKVFKKGGILNATLMFNAGLSGSMAKATVNYTVDGQDYTHQFSNEGNYVGLKLAYFFRPLKSKIFKNTTPKAIKVSSQNN
ncbi:MAG: outer membrane beta-barrel protein [Bacteroidia bacterium]|nr:outer membrane beta-barrel protein [Bacteroidia bacterium]